MLYQIYCLGTIEETQAIERARLFKDLCSRYTEYMFDEEQLEWVHK